MDPSASLTPSYSLSQPRRSRLGACLTLLASTCPLPAAPDPVLSTPNPGWLLPSLQLSLLIVLGLWIFTWFSQRRTARQHAHISRMLKAQTAALDLARQDNKRLAHEATAATRAKAVFLSNISHEIRTPMNAILGMNGLLLDTPLSSQQRELAGTVQTSGEALLTIVNDLLDLSKIEHGALAIEESDLHLRQVVESAVEMFAGKAYEKGLELACLVQANIPTHLRGDAGRIRQVLVNLIGNAIKFTERGEVFVMASLHEQSSLGVVVRFEIRDSGIGITHSTLSQLFLPFAQADSTPSRRFGGTGLGLAISERLVELMRGTIGADSRLGKGSTFWFTVHLAKPSFAHPEHSAVLPLGLAQIPIFVIDDNATQRGVVEHYLQSASLFDQRHFAGGSEALNALSQLPRSPSSAPSTQPGAVILLDQSLRDMDARQFAALVQSHPSLPTLRLILLTPLAAPLDPEQVRQLGFHAWLSKPIRRAHLLTALQQAYTPNFSPPQSLRPVDLSRFGRADPDLAGLRVLVAEDNLPNQIFVRRLLLELGFEAQVVPNGSQALDTLATRAFDIVLMDCHMPDLDGFEATRRIRSSHQPWADIPIIAVTADVGPSTRTACLNAGMDDYVTKPILTLELIESIRRVRSSRFPRSSPHLKGGTVIHPLQTSPPP